MPTLRPESPANTPVSAPLVHRPSAPTAPASSSRPASVDLDRRPPLAGGSASPRLGAPARTPRAAGKEAAAADADPAQASRALFEAAEKGQAAPIREFAGRVQALVAEFGNPWEPDPQTGLTPLQAAARAGHEDCIEALVNLPGLQDERVRMGRHDFSAFDLALANGHLRAASRLLVAPTFDARDDWVRNASAAVGFGGSLENLKWFEQALQADGLQLSFADAMEGAAASGRAPDNVRLLTALCDRLDMTKKASREIWYQAVDAAIGAHKEMALGLLLGKMKKDQVLERVAAQSASYDPAAEGNPGDPQPQRLVSAAVEAGNLKALTLLVDHGFSVEKYPAGALPPLVRAAANGDQDIFRFFFTHAAAKGAASDTLARQAVARAVSNADAGIVGVFLELKPQRRADVLKMVIAEIDRLRKAAAGPDTAGKLQALEAMADGIERKLPVVAPRRGAIRLE